MSTIPQGRLIPPSMQAGMGDHERRIRYLERSPGGGGGGPGQLLALWAGNLPPLATGAAGGIWRVPNLLGAPHTWTVVRTYFRLESPSSAGTYQINIEKSVGGGAFVPTILDTLPLAPGFHEVTDVGTFGTTTSGDLLRVNWTGLGSNGQIFTVQLEGNP
jgi:hypothetical protein